MTNPSSSTSSFLIDDATWHGLSLIRAIKHLKAKDFTARELLSESLRRMQKDNAREDKLNAIVDTWQQEALQQLEAHENIISSPLAGAGFVFKSNMHVQGLPAHCCSNILQGYVSPYNGGVGERLQQHGGCIFAQSNMDQFAMGSANENSIYGPVRNPSHREYIPGGSSGGSAAAVAGGLALAAFGSDTGGSIRQPASLCGVVGLKPTYGRVSRYGLVAFASSFDQIGPITRTVEDAALLLEVIAGYDNRDSTSLKVPVEKYSEGLNGSIAGMKIAMPQEYFADWVDKEVLDAMSEVERFYTQAGVEVKRVSIPETTLGIPIYYVLACAEASANLSRFDGVRYGRRSEEAKNLREVYDLSRSEGFGEEVKRRILIGNYVLSSGYYEAYYRKAQALRLMVQKQYIDAIEGCDAIFTPTVPYKAMKLGTFEKSADPSTAYHSDIFTVGANVAGIPAINVPCGKDSNGLPIGFQLLARPLQEKKILQLGHAYEKENAYGAWIDPRNGYGNS